ncbi:MAG: hypothetical protein J5965_01635 [Aeriscardovia sp.]|nr:hypothetical protein [Aeriscardovia sp.]
MIQEERNNVDNWLKVIADYLLTRDDIKDSLAKENKSLKECGQYILQEARKKGSHVAMTDEEVFGLAVHYYDEDDITVKQTSKADVKVAAQKDDEPLKPLAEYRKEVEQKEPVDIDKIVEERVNKKLAEIKKAEQEKKEKRKAEREAKKPKVNQVSLFDL